MSDLRERFSLADQLGAPDVWPLILARANHVQRPEPETPATRGAGRRIVAGAVAFAVFAVAGVFAWNAFSGSGTSPLEETPSPSADPWASLAPGVNELPPPPETRTGQVIQWTGTQLVVWGGAVNDGARLFNDGYAFEVEDGRWEPLPESPLSARYFAASVWTGREVVIWGGWDGDRGFFDDGAAYDPATRTWRLIARSPLDPRSPLGAVWTGVEMVVWGAGPPMTQRDVTGAAYDPESDTWRTIADGPFPVNWGSLVWTGREMIVLGASVHAFNRPDTATAVGAAYDPVKNSWRQLPPIDVDPNGTFAVWANGRVFALDYNHEARLYDPNTDQWTTLPDLPLDDGEDWPGLASVDGYVFVRSFGGPAVYSFEDDSWETTGLSMVGYDDPIEAGGVVVLWPGDTGGRPIDALLAWKPPERSTKPDGDAAPTAAVEPLIIEISWPKEGLGPTFRATYRGTRIPLDSIETPGPDLEYPRAKAPIPLPGGTPIVVESDADAVAVFELRHAKGEFIVEEGSCIVPGALSAVPASPGPSAFFIYAEWRDAAGGQAFAADLVPGSGSVASPSDSPNSIDATLLGLAVCQE